MSSVKTAHRLPPSNPVDVEPADLSPLEVACVWLAAAGVAVAVCWGPTAVGLLLGGVA
jgi:hypothetical protein